MKLNLYYPSKPYQVYQKFGENDSCYNPKTNEVVTRIGTTCPTDFVGLYAYSGMLGHNGIDMFAPTGHKIYYAGPDGFVEEIVDAHTDARGNGVGVVTNDMFEMEGGVYQAKTRYWHLQSYLVKKGDKLKAGDLIGYADTTGYASGPHLHFELKAVFKGSDEVYYNSFQNNGFYGAVDPTPYFNNLYAEDIKFQHTFYINMGFGETSPEVAQLQRALQTLGLFPTNQPPTGYYGSLTRGAVFAFQKKYVATKSLALKLLVYANMGTYCYTNTRFALNQIFGDTLE